MVLIYKINYEFGINASNYYETYQVAVLFVLLCVECSIGGGDREPGREGWRRWGGGDNPVSTELGMMTVTWRFHIQYFNAWKY